MKENKKYLGAIAFPTCASLVYCIKSLIPITPSFIVIYGQHCVLTLSVTRNTNYILAYRKIIRTKRSNLSKEVNAFHNDKIQSTHHLYKHAIK
jgi:hypothetical protein